jgi:hypothetical protein
MNLSEVNIMKYRNNLTTDYVRECLDYDPETGLLTWKTRPVEHFKTQRVYNTWNTRYAGKKAGSLYSLGYINVSINSVSYTAHRLAWLIFYGKWPEHQIDHDDGDRTNNKISNLNDVPNSVNGKNQKLKVTNKSGCSGVFLNKRNTWEASIYVNFKKIHLGKSKDLNEAIKLRKVAEKQYNFHPNHGRVKHYE